MERPPRLFKYLAPDRLNALDGWLRCSPASVLNDIFEMTVRFTSWESKDALQSVVLEKWPGVLDKALDREFKKAGVSREAVMALPGAKEIMEALVRPFADPTELVQTAMDAFLPKLNDTVTEYMGTAVGVISLAEEPTNLLMWAHYADKHAGFVLEYATDHPWFHRPRSPDDEFFRLRRVHYHSERAGLRAAESSGEDVFLTKSAEWAYEREWRMLFPLEMCEVLDQDLRHGVPVHAVQVPRDAIRRVIVGCRMSPDLRRALTQRASGIPLFMAVPSKDVYGLEIVPLPRDGA